MFVHRLPRRSFVSIALLSSAAVGSFLSACTTTPAPTVVPTPTPSASAPVAAPTAKWVPIEVAPEHDRAAEGVVTINKDTELRIDAAGMRWLVTSNDTKRAESFLPDVPRHVSWQEGIGLVLIAPNGKIYVSTEALGVFTEKGKLPPYADVETALIFRGSIGVIADGKPVTSDDFNTWKPVTSMGDRVAVQAVIGRDGKGLALFAPQAAGATTDGGKTWSTLPDDDAPMAHIALDEEDPSALVVEPARSRDLLSRRWRAGDTLFDLFAPTESPSRRRSAFFDARPRRAFVEEDTKIHERTQKGAGLHQSYVAIDGDTVYFAPVLSGKTETNGVTWSVADLGGKVHHKSVSIPAEKDSTMAGILGDFQPKIAACAGTVAVSSHEQIHIVSSKDEIKSYKVAGQVARIVFLGPRKVLAILSGGRTNPAEPEASSETSIEIDLDASDPKAAIKSAKLEAKKDGFSGMLFGGCSPSTKSAWLISSSAKSRVQMYREGTWSVVTKIDREPDTLWDGLGVDADGTLSMLEVGEKSGTVVRVSPTGEVSRKDTGFKVSSQLLVGDLSARRAVVLDIDLHAHMTTDAGENWVTLADPPRALKRHRGAVLCGATRCEVDDTVVRVGWEPDAASLVPNLSESASAADEKKPVIEAMGPPPVSFTCSIDRASAPKLSDKLEGVHAVVAGRGDALWAGVASVSSPIENAPAHYVSVVGKADGTISSFELGRTLPERDAQVFATESMGASFVTGVPSAVRPNDLTTYSVAWQRDFNTAPKKATLKSLWGLGEWLTRPIQTEDGFAVVEPVEQKVWWFHADGKTTTRAWPSSLIGRLSSAYGARMLETSSGAWIALLPAAESYAVRDSSSIVSLLMIEPDGARKVRALRIFPGDLEERGLGLVKDGAGVSLALVERGSDGGLELRLRPINADLSLGPAKLVPGAKSGAGKILSLPACTATPSGETITLMTDDEASVTIDSSDHSGVMLRRARVTPSGACVERTMITRALASELDTLLPSESDLEIVLTGNGSGAGVLHDKKNSNEPVPVDAIKCTQK